MALFSKWIRQHWDERKGINKNYIHMHLWEILTRLCYITMGLLPDTQNRGLRMHRGCRERFPRHRLQRKPLVNDPGMHHGTCLTHVSWCMSGSLNRGGGENVPGISGACATPNFTYLARGPWKILLGRYQRRNNEAEARWPMPFLQTTN